MATEVSADLSVIQDEDILRRMWADTEDFGRKKEIRARMYKLREQRLKDFYTTGDVVTEVTGRKHQTKTHTDSISDQGFITMKTKEIRDSESPTRDFHQNQQQRLQQQQQQQLLQRNTTTAVEQDNNNGGYWNQRQEHTYATGKDDGAIVTMKSNVLEGQGTVKDDHSETKIEMAAHNLHESKTKTDENMSAKSEHHSHASKLVTSSKSDYGDSSSTVMKSTNEERHQQQQQQQEQHQSSTSTKWSTSSTSSTSKKVVSSSSQNYQITSGQQEIQTIQGNENDNRRIVYRVVDDDTDAPTVTRRYVDTSNADSRINETNVTQESYNNRVTSHTTNRTTSSQNVNDNAQERITYITDRNVDNDQPVRTTSDVNIQNTQVKKENRVVEQSERLYEHHDTTREEKRTNETYAKNIVRNVEDNEQRHIVDRHTDNTEHRRIIHHERVDTDDVKTKPDTHVTDNVDNTKIIRETRVQRNDANDVRQTTRVDRTNRTEVEANTTTVTDQKIMNEIQKLDSYLSSQNTPAQSTPASPHATTVTDNAKWTVVSSRDGEFIYHEQPTPTQKLPTEQKPTPAATQKVPEPQQTPIDTTIYPDTSLKESPAYNMQPRDKPVKHPSSIDLPKESTDGQYLTTYQQSYNRISVDNSPSHEFFASTLRASPDRSSPSPGKRAPSRGSLDRSSPSPGKRAPSRGSLDRSSPLPTKHTPSKGSLDRSSPERRVRVPSRGSMDRSSPESKHKPSTKKVPDSERRPSTGSYTIERSPVDSRRKQPSDTVRNNSISETTSKTKRKFTSTQTKTTNKTRVSTPGSSPTTSPTRKYTPKDTITTTDSDSDVSHGTYKKSTTITQERNEKVNVTTTEDKTNDKPVTSPKGHVPRTTPRETSPEYSSEGSVSREIKESRIREQRIDTNSAFTPIKARPNDGADDKEDTRNLISTERHYVIDEKDNTEETIEDFPRKKLDKPRDGPDDKPDYITTDQTTIETTDTSILNKQINVKDTVITKRQSPYSSTEQIKEKSVSPVRKGYQPDSRSPSSSSSPERRSPARQQPQYTKTTTHRDTRSFINEEKRVPVKPKHTENIPRKHSLDKKTIKTEPDSPRKKLPSPAQSPERPATSKPKRISTSPDKPSSTRRTPQPQQITPHRSRPEDSTRIVKSHTETNRQKTTTRKTVVSDTKSPRKGSLPKTDTPGRTPGPYTNRKPQTLTSPMQKSRTPLTERTVVTITKTSSVNDRKPTNKNKISPVQAVRKTPTSPNKKLTSPSKTSTTVLKFPKESTTITTKTTINKEVYNKASNQKENKRPTRPTPDTVTPVRQKTTPKSGPTTTTTTTRKTHEVNEFINREKIVTSDLEDECPPDEFYTDFDEEPVVDKTPKSKDIPQRTKETISTVQTTSRVNKTVADTKKTPEKPVKNQPSKKILKESTSLNQTVKTIKQDLQRSVDDSDTSSTTSSSTEDEQPCIDDVNLTTEQVKVTKTSNQDLLTVTVQHPKSSRESSPGYPSEGMPIYSVSEGGESNPRYADFISEPEDGGDLTTKLPSGKQPYGEQTIVQVTDLDDDEETGIRTSVADRVNEFLEATKRESQVDSQQVQIDTTKSVLKTKAMFENIAKNQTTTTTKSTNRPQNVEPISQKSVKKGQEPEIKSKPETEHTKPSIPESTSEDDVPADKISKSNKIYDSKQIHEEEIVEETTLIQKRKPSEPLEPVKTTKTPQPSSPNKVRPLQEPQEYEDIPTKQTPKSKITHKTVVDETTTINKTRKQSEPKTPQQTKPFERQPSGPTPGSISTKKDFFERKTHTVDNKSNKIETTPVKTVQHKVPKEITKGPKNVTNELQDTHTERTESSYMRSTVASSVRSHTPDKYPKDRRDSKAEEPVEEEDVPDELETVEAVESSYMRSTMASSVRAQAPDKYPKDRRDSKPTEPTRPGVHERSPTKPSAHERSPTRPSDHERSPTRPSGHERSPTRPSDHQRSQTRPSDHQRSPTRPSDHQRSPTRPSDHQRSPTRPSDHQRSPTRPSDHERSPTRKVSKPDEPIRKTSKPHDDIIRKSTVVSREEQHHHTQITQRRASKERSQSPEKTTIKSPNKIIEITKTKPTQSDTTSPRRTSKPEHPEQTKSTLFKQTEKTVEEINREGKFGVTLRKTPSSTKVTTVTTMKTTPQQKKLSSAGNLPEIEDIFDLDILEELLLKAVGYDERRRIRAQIRIVKKQLEELYNTPGKSLTTTTTTTTKYTTTIPSVKDIKAQSPKYNKPEQTTIRTTKQHEIEEIKRRTSPDRKSPDKKIINETVRTFKKETSPEKQLPKSTTTDRKSSTTTIKQQPRETTTTTSTTIRRISMDKPDDVVEDIKSNRSHHIKSEANYESSTTVKSQSYRQITNTTTETCPTDSITSSYGVGPTDENGRPLFGLKALRRTNTNKSLGEHDFDEQIAYVDDDEDDINEELDQVSDKNGRPLFGLKALQVTTEEDTTTMPGQTAQLRELVEKHQQYVRESSTKEIKPVQKPKAKLRDSFILTSENDQTNTTTTTTTSNVHHQQQLSDETSTPGLSLRSIIKKHEDISNTGEKVESEMQRRSTVMTSQSTISSDGKITHKRNVIHGELSSKNGEAPSGKITQKTYSYQSADDKQSQPIVKSITKTATIGNEQRRRSSGPRIEEIKEIQSSENTSRRYSKEYVVVDDDDDDVDDLDDVVIDNESSNNIITRRKSSTINDEQKTTTSILKSSTTNKDDWYKTKQQNSGGGSTTTTTTTTTIRKPKLTEFPGDDLTKSSKLIKTTTTTTTTKTSSSDIDKDDSATTKKPFGRGDSVKALQHKFQQATEAVNQSTTRAYPPAGLILRSNSLNKNDDDQNLMSSTMKQSNIERNDLKGKTIESKTHETVTSSSSSSSKSTPLINSTQVKTLEDSQIVKTTTSPTTITTKITMITKEPIKEITNKVAETSTTSSTMKTSASGATAATTTTTATSFLDDKTKVSGVQDILTRMRNADLVTESSDTNEDAEARALLNKFLGASVILQSMEQGMHSVTGKTGNQSAPSSTALVIQAEKQRVKDVTRTLEDEIDDICDEKQLRILLESCSDYEGRRKIRARLRTIMAERESTDASEMALTSEGGDTTKTEIHTRTVTSTARLTKANSVQSPFAKFKQMERQNSAPNVGRGAQNLVTEPKVMTSVSYIKEHLLNWVQAQTRAYKNVQIENFSTSWSNGLAFCALIHHFCPNAFDYNKLTPENRRYNFELAFRVAEEQDIYPLLDVDDMVTMRKPDWKCVFTYVQSVYRRYQNSPDALPANPYLCD